MTTSRSHIRLFVADSHPAFRKGIESAVLNESDMVLLGETGDGEQAVRAIRRLHPDVCLAELELPVIDGVHVVTSVVRDGLACRVLIMSGHLKTSVIRRALASGAAGVLHRRESLENIGRAVREAYNGLEPVSDNIRIALENDEHESGNLDVFRIPVRPRLLTAREFQVLRCIAHGASITSTAQKLNMSATTVKHHRKVIFNKLGVTNAPAAVYVAMLHNLLH